MPSERSPVTTPWALKRFPKLKITKSVRQIKYAIDQKRDFDQGCHALIEAGHGSRATAFG
jgi:hypothetical protein